MADGHLEPETFDAGSRSGIVVLVTRVAYGLLACAVMLMTAQVILRFGFNDPQAWAEEVDRYLFIWSVYLGATVALMKGTHIRVTFVTDRFGPAGEAFSQWVTRIVGFLAFAFTAYYGCELAWVNRTAQFYTIAWMPQIIFYLAAPVGLTMMALVYAWQIVAGVLDWRRG